MEEERISLGTREQKRATVLNQVLAGSLTLPEGAAVLGLKHSRSHSQPSRRSANGHSDGVTDGIAKELRVFEVTDEGHREPEEFQMREIRSIRLRAAR